MVPLALLMLLTQGNASLQLRGIDGRYYRPLSEKGTSVLIFTTRECPISNAYAPEINRIAKEYSSRKVRLYLVNVEPGVKPAEVKRHAIEYRIASPVLLDERQALARAVGAKVTPEAAVLRSGKLMYLGRIDDQFFALGGRRPKVSSRDLRDALEAVIAGKKVRAPQVRAVGCLLPAR